MNGLAFIINNCTECKLCVNECPFLSKHNKTPKEIAKELVEDVDLSKSYVMECFLCGLCQAVCPLSLDFPKAIFHARQALSAEALNNICYKLSLPDETLFFPKAYKRYKNLNYNVFEKDSFTYAFFPGCAMSCYSHQATIQVYKKLTETLNDVGFADLCCGKPLADVGLSERASKWLMQLESYLNEHDCTTIVTACPMCYYYLRSKFQNEFRLLTVYEVLGETFKKGLATLDAAVTVHDSCPDRFKGVFAKHVRNLFRNGQIMEMPHCKEKSICCGAGGLVSCVDPNLSALCSSARAVEFLESGAELMVVYCYTCAQAFWLSQPKMQTKHVIDLALKTHDASEDVKNQEVSSFAMKLIMGEA
ncbi:MAG: (Fe-S)-binding protein [Candidatus Bathyarchaeia archaeon]